MKITCSRGVVLMVLFIAVQLDLAFAAPSIQVGENILVSADRSDQAHYEVLLAADPKNPRNLLSGSMVFSEKENKYFLAAHGSTDKGKTWTPVLEVRDFDTGAFDPAVAFGPDNTAYFAGLGTLRKSSEDTFLFHSENSLSQWQQPEKLDLGIDREFLTVDCTGGKFNGRLYLYGMAWGYTLDRDPEYATDITILRSDDHGKTFSKPVKLLSVGSNYTVTMSNGIILSDGTFIVAFGEVPQYWRDNGSGVPAHGPKNPNMQLKIIASEDGGVSFSKANKVTEWYLDFPEWNTSLIPYLASDQSNGPFRDRIYLVWNDERSKRSQINFSFSSDKGKSWSEPIIINDETISDNSARDHFMPVVAVNSDGIVGILWYDRSESSNNQDWWVRFTASIDGGESFFPSVRVSSSPFSHEEGKYWPIWAESIGGGNIDEWNRGGLIQISLGIHGFYFNGGHTAGLVASEKSFHPLWIDNRTGIPQIWTTEIFVEGTAQRNGVDELSPLQDLTEKVGLVITDTRYDVKSKTVSANIHFVNTSNETLTSPLKARLFSIKSAVGIPEILDSTGNGILDLSPLLSNTEFKPKERTKSMPLQFRLKKLQSPKAGTDYMVRLVSLKARVYGTLVQDKKP